MLLNIRKVVLFIFIFSTLVTICSQTQGLNEKENLVLSPEGDNYFFTYKGRDDITEFYVHNGEIDVNILIRKMRLYRPLRMQGIVWHTNELLEVNVETGSPGNFSVFYCVTDNLISDNLYFPVAVDAKRKRVLIADESVYIRDIFVDKFKFVLEREFALTAIKWLVIDRHTTHFNKDGSLSIRYLNKDNEWVEEIVKGF
jgi:hypothetical protein